MKKKVIGGYSRNSNLELYRIIVMLLIIAHHYVVNSGLTDSGGVIFSAPLSAKSLFLLIFGAWGKTGINCFVLITGYFMCCSQITVKKFAKLFLEIKFYSVVFWLIFLFSGYEQFSIRSLVAILMPLVSVTNDFSSCFLLFYLCIPFLNILIRHISERQHVRLILLLSFIYVFWGTIPKLYVFFGAIPKLYVNMNYVSWFCVLYIIAAYIRLYPKKTYERTSFWGVMTFVSVMLSVASIVFCAWFGKVKGLDIPFYFVSDSNSFLAVTNGVCSFMLFKNLKIKQSRFINTVAASTFGVLCIHANSDTMRRWLWKDTLNNVGAYSSNILVAHAIISVVAIFTICVCIDQVRIHLIEKPFFKVWDKKESGIMKMLRRF